MKRGKPKLCGVSGCGCEIPNYQAFCHDHWDEIPAPTRKAMLDAKRNHNTLGYHRAVGEALEFFARAARAKADIARQPKLFGESDA